MRILCPTCGTLVPAEDVNLDRMVAKCRSCDSVFAIDAPAVAHPGPPADTRRAIERTPPSGLTVHLDRPFADLSDPGRYREPGHRPDPGTLTITRKWWKASALFLLFFACFWDGFLVLWYSIAFTTGAPIVMVLFPLLHVAAGVGITYLALATLLNRTTLVADARKIVVAHRPLPWKGAGEIDAANVRRVYVGSDTGARKGPPTYRVLAETDVAGDHPILAGVSEAEAEHVAALLREHLGVPG